MYVNCMGQNSFGSNIEFIRSKLSFLAAHTSLLVATSGELGRLDFCVKFAELEEHTEARSMSVL